MGTRLVLIILMSIAPAPLFAGDIYVAPGGSDAAPGDKDKPLQNLEAVGDGFVLPGRSGQLRAHFIGSPQAGFDVVFERNEDGRWKAVGGFVPGQVWTVCTDWKESWYGQPQHVKIQNVEAIGKGQARGTATAVIGGQKWNFADVYVIQDDFVRIERTFEHADAGNQTKISLVNRVRIVRGDDLRMLVPGSLYNGNPGATMPGPSLSYEPGSIGLYEEHRLPIPMVNVESQVAGRRLHGSLLAQPGKIPQGHKGDDHWWSLGLEFGQGYVDLLSVSGAVATNGKKSHIYGHRNGLDVYDDAWLDVRGPVTFQKTLYLDLGTAMAAGDSFRHMLWKAFEVFRPIDTPHLPFDQAMALKLDYAKSTFYRDQQGAAGYCQWPGPNRYFQYGWCGGGEAIAYAMLAESGRTGDEQARRQAIEAVNFFVRGASAGSKGLCFGDYDAGQHRWLPAGFHGSGPGISSRQFGEVLDRLGDLILLGRKLNLDVKPWENALRKGCDFLLASPRCRGLYPRAWNIDGTPLGWQPGKEPVLSAAGASCIWPLVKMARIGGEKTYLDRAVEVMEAYGKQFGPQSPTPPWGATLDAGGEDKEAGWELMHAALDVYEANKDKRFLDLARWAADWTLTWMYFHDIGLRKDSVLYGRLHTVGWTFISTQNQEIDVFAYWIAPDYCRLGSLLHDPRYKQIAKVMYDACTQTIARPGDMFGQSALGIQAEHYNHTNCTYVGGQPGTWRGTQQSMGISWVTAGGLYGGTKLAETAPEEFCLEGEWSRFRGPNGSGISGATTVPTRWSEKDYNWKVKLPGVGHSSPVAWGKRIFVTCGDPVTALRTLLCLDAVTGRALWKREYPSKTYSQHSDNNYASATPAVDADGVVITWSTPEAILLLALDLEGHELWRRDLGPLISIQGSGSSPILYRDLVVLANDQEDMERSPGRRKDGPNPAGRSFLIAVDRKSGRTRWQTATKTFLAGYSTPCIYQAEDGRAELIFSNTAHGIMGVDPATGKVNWEFGRPFMDRAVISPVVAPGLVIAGHGAGIRGDRCIAVRPGSPGQQTPPTLAYAVTKAIPMVPTPLVKDGRLFLWTDDGVVSCLRVSSGEVVWRERVGGAYYASPVWVNHCLYGVARNGDVVVLAAGDKFEILGRMSLGEPSYATPAVAGGVMYLRTRSQLFSLGGTGKKD